MSARRVVAWQNMTEGDPTRALLRADVVLGSEVGRRRWRRGFRGHGLWLPARDRKQAIAWDGDVDIQRRGYERFHRSGRAEGWRKIRTPGRGLIWVMEDVGDVELVYGGMHWLNSWEPIPAGQNRHTRERRRIVEQHTLPVVRDFIAEHHAKGRIVVLGGDTNSLRWDGDLPGMRQVKSRGLDRAWVSDDPRVKKVRVTRGPKTGVGRQMRHHAVIVHLSIRTKEKPC